MDGQVLVDGSGSPSAYRYQPRRSPVGIALVVLLHLVLLWGLVNGLAQRVVEVIKGPIETRLIEEVRPPPPPPPVLPLPTVTPPPLVIQVPVPTVAPPPLAPPPMAAPSVAPPPAPPPPAAEAPRAAPPGPTITVAPAPPPAPAGAQAQTPEQLYSARLLGYVNGIKRYPTSREARQLRPEGIVRIWLEIDRAGELLDSGVDATSGTLLLDNEALRTVRNGKFPAFPAEAFGGQPKHRFVVAMEYLRPGN